MITTLMLTAVARMSLPQSSASRFDSTQAEAMLRFLKLAREHKATRQDVEELLAMHGTGLVIRQQNISRTVDEQQYREILQGLIEGRMPDFKPVREDQRSRNGVKGLKEDDWPSLVWGMQHADVLASRLSELRKMDVSRRATAIALANLPEKVEFEPQLSLVMGGRAGAAAIQEEIFFDVLITSFRAESGYRPYPNPDEIVEFFAHEMHHIGLGKIIERMRTSLRLNDSEQHGFSLLDALVLEGSATLLINAHGGLESMQNDPTYGSAFRQLPNLLKTTQQMLMDAVSGQLNDESYDRQVGAFLGSGYHVTGAALLSAIERGSGKESVRAVMRDPRLLLMQYNSAAASNKTLDWHFDPELTIRIARLGKTK